MTKRKVVIATRESLLALKQAEIVKNQILKYHPDIEVDFLGITTEADKRLNVTLAKIGGKGLFVKELETTLFDGRANIAAHSMKDVPMHLPQGMVISAIMERDDPRDTFISNKYNSLAALPSGASVGTSSLRRKTQIALLRQDLNLQNLRGNIHTRLKRLDDGDFDAIILASAGLRRMNMANRIKNYLSTDEMLPAAGQGAIGIECRADDDETIALVKPLHDAKTAACVTAERALCRRLGGGCSVPIAAYATLNEHGTLTVRGVIAAMQGDYVLRASVSGDAKDAESLGIAAAEILIADGAENLLAEFRD